MTDRPVMRHARHFLTLIAVFTVTGCASVPDEARSESDPWEPLNRTVFDVVTAVDDLTLKPLAKGYEKVIPRPVRRGVSNFMNNLDAPRSVINNFLQGKPAAGFSESARFLLNSTLGIGGLFDVATASGIEEKREDFGQTAAVWGVPNGPYVMLPFFGPHTLRDALMRPLDMASNPLYYYDNTSARDKIRVLRIIDLRAGLLAADKFLEDSKDPYITLRESYLQNREYQVYDGNPPDDDEFFDEFLDEEFYDEEPAVD